jgi:hypothetical protein
MTMGAGSRAIRDVLRSVLIHGVKRMPCTFTAPA